MFPFKKSQYDEKEEEEIKKIAHEAEFERRKELAKEHGIADAEKKYGKFKEGGSLMSGLKGLKDIVEGILPPRDLYDRPKKSSHKSKKHKTIVIKV